MYFKVIDVNDNAPLFNSPYYSSSVEEAPDNLKFVVDVNATDLDEGSNGFIQYSIVKGNEKDMFSIDNNTVSCIFSYNV